MYTFFLRSERSWLDQPVLTSPLTYLQEFELDEVTDLTLGVVLLIFADFLYLFLASLALGAAFGLATAFFLRNARLEHTAQEVALIGLTSYLSYLAGDVVGLSGILSLFVCAVATSHYALHNISPQSRVTTVYAFQTLSYVSEGIIFVYCGMDALDPMKWQVRLGGVGWGDAGLGMPAWGRRLGMPAAWGLCRTLQAAAA